MSKEKYLANIDRVLQDVIRKTSHRIEDQNKIPYSEELEKNGTFKRIAFDVFRAENDPYGDLWTVEDYQGKPYLVRASEPVIESIAANDWTVTSDYEKSNVTLSYKKIPITRFSSKEYGFDVDDIICFKQALLDTIHSDQSFIKDVLLEQPESKRLALMNSFPEFKKIIGG